MGVAFGRSPQEMRGFAPRRNTGFTLVEMLVVIGIIAMLAGILLPVLSHVWESSRRTKCASNLREIGRTCAAFADRHSGYFPMCYRMRDTTSKTYPYYVPFCISQGGVSGKVDPFSNDGNQNYWGVFGTSWIEWQSCGANLQVFTCPSSSGNGAYAADLTSTNPEWGAVIWTDYMYVGGLSYFNVPVTPTTPATLAGSLCGYGNLEINQAPVVYGSTHSTGHWGTALPAVQANAGIAQQGGRTYTSLSNPTMVAVQTDTAVLAADLCFQQLAPGPGAPFTVKTNHPLERSLPGGATMYAGGTNLYWVPDFQNVLYADGSVSSHGQEDYLQPLNTDKVGTTGNGTLMDTGPNWSMVISDPALGGVGGYCYWGENEAIPPLLAAVTVQAGPSSGVTWLTPPPKPNPNPILLTPPPPPPTSTAPQTIVPFNP